MADKVSKELSNELYTLMQKERFTLLATVDHETKGPNVNAISWVIAPTNSTIRFAVDNRSRILENIKAEPNVSITVIAQGTVYTISGTARILEEKMEGVPLKLAKVEILISAVRDVMFYGSRIVQEPGYEKTYDLEAAKKLDNQVLEALKKA